LVKRFPIVYLPVEIRSREFDSKMLIAAALAKRGYSVVVGEQWTIYNNFPRLPPGAVLFKSMNMLHQAAMLEAKGAHHSIFVLEEELLAHTQKKAIEGFCVPGIFEIPDVMLATGAFEKSVFAELSGGKVEIEIAGNPRVDFLKPAFRSFFKRGIDTLRAHFGDFILVNTNFGITNSVWRDIDEIKRIFVESGFLRLDDPQSVSAFEDKVAFELANKAGIIAAIEELSRRRPSLNIVVRPHPAEAMGHWKGLSARLPNVQIIREGAHVPWTLACKVLLHTSCTTGFEAAVAGKMSMSLAPRLSWLTESFIYNRLNPVFSDPITLVDAVEAYLDRGEPPAAGPSHLSPGEAADFVWNIGDKNSAQRLSVLLTKDLPSPRGRVPLPPLAPYDRGETQKRKLTVSLEECGDVLARIIGIIGKGQMFGLDQIGDSLFYLSPAAK
jgi:surface carbohydrate biosynthesis protein